MTTLDKPTTTLLNPRHDSPTALVIDHLELLGFQPSQASPIRARFPIRPLRSRHHLPFRNLDRRFSGHAA